MTTDLTFQLDGEDIAFTPGQTIMQAAKAAGVYIPHLCWHPDFPAHGSCKLCTVKANGRFGSGCTMEAQAGMVVENRTAELDDKRRTLLQMFFVEGNHFCPSCEKSGDCTLQATAYELKMMSPHFDMFYPDRPVDASHPDVLLDFNRCIMCSLCVTASRDVDKKERVRHGRTRHPRPPHPHQQRIGQAGRHRLRPHRPRRRHLPGRRDPSQAQGLRRADRRAPLRQGADQRTGQGAPEGGRAMNAPINTAPVAAKKLKVATTSLAGCFGCHMSFLDIDERILKLLELVEFDRSPLTDIKHCGPCDLGLIEGGLCNAENVHVLREFRKNCKILVAVGACAINGGLPAQRNHLDLRDILEEVYQTEYLLGRAGIPNDPELPLPLDKVHPIHEVVKVDYFLPGCPPPADAFWKLLTDLLAGRTPTLGHGLLHYD
jgi:coenzyme F420-reducing hydrogenase gamma subunit